MHGPKFYGNQWTDGDEALPGKISTPGRGKYAENAATSAHHKDAAQYHREKAVEADAKWGVGAGWFHRSAAMAHEKAARRMSAKVSEFARAQSLAAHEEDRNWRAVAKADREQERG